MKKLFLPILLALIIAPAFHSFTQTPNSNTAPSDKVSTDTVPADQTITFLIDQNEKAKALITTQETRIKDLEAEVSAERENGESLTKSYAAAQAEISSLKNANESLHKAVTINEQTIALLQSDRDKWKDKAKKETRAKYKAWAVAAGVIALKFLLP
jgi:peptidoglycan hydrolase CwlO-like protein